jgi:hypothetical protein
MGKARQAHISNYLAAICVPVVHNIRHPRKLKTLWATTASNRNNFTFILCYVRHCTLFNVAPLGLFGLVVSVELPSLVRRAQNILGSILA